MVDLLVHALREDEALSTNAEWRVLVCNTAANRIEELEALVDRLTVAGRDLCCHIPRSDLMIGVSDETKAVIENIIWKEGKDD